MMKSEVKPKRTVLFAFFGAEDQELRSSRILPGAPGVRLKQNYRLDQSRWGWFRRQNFALAGKTSPGSTLRWTRPMPVTFTASWAPITGAMWPALAWMRPAFWIKIFPLYHCPFPGWSCPIRRTIIRDNPSIINPEILEDLARLLFMGVMERPPFHLKN